MCIRQNQVLWNCIFLCCNIYILNNKSKACEIFTRYRVHLDLSSVKKFNDFVSTIVKLFTIYCSLRNFKKMEICLRWADNLTFCYKVNESIKRIYIWKLFNFEQAFEISGQFLIDIEAFNRKRKSTVCYGIGCGGVGAQFLP